MITRYEVLSVTHFDKSIDNWKNIGYDDAKKFLYGLPIESYTYGRFIIETGKKH
jgi:hypothetical protein